MCRGDTRDTHFRLCYWLSFPMPPFGTTLNECAPENIESKKELLRRGLSIWRQDPTMRMTGHVQYSFEAPSP